MLVSLSLLPRLGDAGSVRPARLNEELGEALGFHVLRFEPVLEADEVVVIHHVIEKSDGTRFENETVVRPLASEPWVYQVVAIDSGQFHKSLRGSCVLRYGGNNLTLEGMELAHRFLAVDGFGFVFNRPGTNEMAEQYTWRAWVEKHGEVAERFERLPGLGGGHGWTSVRSLDPNKDTHARYKRDGNWPFR
ncbi:hypothetical protein ASA1KI_31090 [Opitutales bacterium ASA1]|nr:hypothetical protein ASA1KI_31090 [Opitutales bacterium ASA1]